MAKVSVGRWRVKECPQCNNLVDLDRWMCEFCATVVEDAQPFDVIALDLEGEGQARREDPSTSRLAAEIKVNRGSQRWKVLNAIADAGERGATSHELVDSTGIRYASLTPRIGELKRGGLIRASGETRIGKYGVEQEVLVLAKSSPDNTTVNPVPGDHQCLLPLTSSPQNSSPS